MEQGSASQSTGNQALFGRKLKQRNVVLLAIVGLAVAIVLIFTVSQIMARRTESRLRNVNTPIAEYALGFKDNVGKMRQLEETILLNVGSDDFSSGLNNLTRQYDELNRDSYRRLLVLERALELGFDGQNANSMVGGVDDLRAAENALVAIITSQLKRVNLPGNSARGTELDQQIALDHSIFLSALNNIDSSINTIINLTEFDGDAQAATLTRTNWLGIAGVVVVVFITLLLITTYLNQGDEEGTAQLSRSRQALDRTPVSQTALAASQSEQHFFGRIQNQLLIVFLVMVGLSLAIGLTSVFSQSLARRTSARLINVDIPIAQYALDFQGDISELRRLEEVFQLDVRSNSLEPSIARLNTPWESVRDDVSQRIRVLERALEIGFEGQLSESMQSSLAELRSAERSLNIIVAGYRTRADLFESIQERTETMTVLSVLLSFSNIDQEDLRDAARINDLTLTLYSREYLLTGDLENLSTYESLVNQQFVEGDPISELLAESVVDFKTLFNVDQEIASQRASYKRSLERIDNNLTNIIDLTIADQTGEEASLDRTNGIAIAVIVALILATVLPIGVYFLTVGGRTFKQIEGLQDTVEHVQHGDYQARVQLVSSDETRIVADRMNEMLDTTFSLIQSGDEQDRLQNAIMQLLVDVSDVADGDMTARAVGRHEMIDPMAQAFNETVAQLHDLLKAVGGKTDEVFVITQAVSNSASIITENSESQVDHIVDTTAAVDEMAISIQQVSQNAQRSAEVSKVARSNARFGSNSVRETIQGLARIELQTGRTLGQVARLAEAAENVGHTISLIDDISDQTSVLALNASIRALAAGNEGLGFTVVAREIEELSSQVSQAVQRVIQLTSQIEINAQETSDAMALTQGSVSKIRLIADEAATQLVAIEAVTNRFGDIIAEISQVTHHQAANSELVARSMNGISNTTQQAFSGSRDTIKSLESLKVLTTELRESIDLFKLDSAESELAEITPGTVTA